jgi:protease-4
MRRDSKLDAVLVRIDSPGGSAVASDLMWASLMRLREHKPIVVSMANVAASGGYYVAGLPNTRILAAPTTVTGSIGVLGGKFVLNDLYTKLGIRRARVQAGARAGYFSEATPWTDEELGKLESDLDDRYRDFVQKMAAARGKSFEELHAVAQGRVWTGRAALAHGLVDSNGGLHAAMMAIKAELEVPAEASLELVTSRPRGRGIAGWLGLPEPEQRLSEIAEALGGLPLDLARERLFALMPFRLELS